MRTFNTLAFTFLITFFVSAVANAILNARFMLIIPRGKAGDDFRIYHDGLQRRSGLILAGLRLHR